MMKLTFFMSLLALSMSGNAQLKSKLYLRGDSTIIYKDSGNAELILLNATRNIPGFLYNSGNGRTAFKLEEDPTVSSYIKTITAGFFAHGETAFGWGNHATAGYATSFSETDPSVSAYIKTITSSFFAHGETAFGWGNHATAGYVTSFSETDPSVSAYIKTITASFFANGETAYGWGNHAVAGYYQPSSQAAFTNYGNRSGAPALPAFFLNPFADSLKIEANGIYQRVNGNWNLQFNARNLDTTFLKLNATSLGTTVLETKGLNLVNPTSATSILVQNSPAIHLSGNGWVTSPAGNNPTAFRIYVSPVNSASLGQQLAATLLFQTNASGTWSNALTLSGSGAASFANTLTTLGGVAFSNGNITSGIYTMTTANGTVGSSIDGLVLNSLTAALPTFARLNMYSPSMKWNSSALNTSNVAQSGNFRAEVRPTHGITPITAKWVLSSSIAGSAFADYLTINSNGTTETTAQVIGGSTKAASAIVDEQSTTKGHLHPRMTTAQRDAIATPDEGLIIYNLTTHKLNIYTTVWEQMTSL